MADVTPENRSHALASNVCEFLEIAFHTILFVRNVYPKSSFQKCRKYNIIVWQSVHPDVRAYIIRCLNTAEKLLARNELEKIEMCVLNEAEVVTDSYIFETRMLEMKQCVDLNTLILGLEQSFRDCILRLSTCNSLLQASRDGWRFSIQIYCSEPAALTVNNPDDLEFQCFPWIEANLPENNNGKIIPVKNFETIACKFQMYMLEKTLM